MEKYMLSVSNTQQLTKAIYHNTAYKNKTNIALNMVGE